MNEIEIKVLDMSAVLKPSDSFALVLEELGGHFRKLALIIGKQEAQAIKMGQMSYTPPRPFTHDLMLAVMKEGGLTPVKGLIYEVKDGIYSSYLYVQREDGTEFQVDARTTDVISLALRKKFPLYVYEDMPIQSVKSQMRRSLKPNPTTPIAAKKRNSTMRFLNFELLNTQMQLMM